MSKKGLKQIKSKRILMNRFKIKLGSSNFTSTNEFLVCDSTILGCFYIYKFYKFIFQFNL